MKHTITFVMDDCRDEQGNLEPLAVTDLPIIESVQVDNLETPPAILDVCTLQFHQQLWDLVGLILGDAKMDQMKEPRPLTLTEQFYVMLAEGICKAINIPFPDAHVTSWLREQPSDWVLLTSVEALTLTYTESI